MTISPNEPEFPVQPCPRCDELRHLGAESNNQRPSEPLCRTNVSLYDWFSLSIQSWGTLIRALVLIVTVVATLVVGTWLLPVDVVVEPVPIKV
jgi:hypothetical protein